MYHLVLITFYLQATSFLHKDSSQPIDIPSVVSSVHLEGVHHLSQLKEECRSSINSVYTFENYD
jgi:hypothetical protein